MIQMNIFTKQKHTEYELLVTRGKGVRGGVYWEFGIDMYTLLYVK